MSENLKYEEKSITLNPNTMEIDKAEDFMREIFADIDQGAFGRNFVVFDELFSNAVKFSGCTSITLTCSADEKVIKMQIAYDGDEFDVTSTGGGALSLGIEVNIGGLGLYMVGQMTSLFTYKRENGLNIINTEVEINKK